jgi:hypothetical protein
MGLAMFSLALGPELQVDGVRHSGVATPYRLLEPLAFLRLIRYPERLAMCAALPFSAMAAWGVYSFTHNRPRVGWLALAGLCVLIPLDYRVAPLDLESAEVPAIYSEIADPDGGAVLDLPIDDMWAKKYMYAQTVHERPILGGNLSASPMPPTALSWPIPGWRPSRPSRRCPPTWT